MTTDILVIGAGMAGSVAALTAADEGREVLLATKNENLHGGSTYYAQGGIVYRGHEDSPEKLKADIMKAGAGHSFGEAVDVLCQDGPALVKELLIDRLQVPFAFDEEGDAYYRTAEAAHSVPRILYAQDRTGKVILTTLQAAVKTHRNIKILTERTAIDLLTTSHHSTNPDDTYRPPACFGALFFNQETRQVEPVLAQQTILATGGVGQLYLHTTNPPEARGDGIAMAWRAGARCINLHYIQFHPTALYHLGQRFLISEAVRGEGGILVDGRGKEFMLQFHPDGNLAPRDVVARGIHQTMIEQKLPCVYLDITHKPGHWLQDRFPTIYAYCKEAGVDMTTEFIPVVPAAHYSCGGVDVDLEGRTTIGDLYAVGEVSCTGVHGANRLASTSLLECLTWGRAAGLSAAGACQGNRKGSFPPIRDWEYQREEIDQALIAQDWETIRNIMWNYVGLVRTPKRMHRARTMLRQLQTDIEDFYQAASLSDDMVGLRNGVQTAMAILYAATEAKESRGCHYVTADG